MIFILLAFSFIFAGFFIGYYRITPPGNQPPPITEEGNLETEVDLNDIEPDLNTIDMVEDERPVTHYEDNIGEETKIIYKTFYTVCQSTLEETLLPIESMIGLNKTGFQEYLTINNLLFDVENFSADEVVVFQTKDAISPKYFNTYLVTESDGYIAIYRIDERGDRILIEKTPISIAVLPHVDQEKLKRGIFRKTRAEVYQLLEDYSS